MVSFIANPRIKQAEALRRAMLSRALTQQKAPSNPYGYSPWAGAATQLASALGARWAGQEATELEEAQQLAQGDIFSALTEARQPTTVAPLDVQGGQFMRVPYRRRAVDIPTETLKTAGTTKQAIAGDVSSIDKAAKAAYTNRQNAAIDAAIVKAYQDDNEEAVAALRLLRDPMKATKPGTEKGPRFYPSATGGPGAGTIVSPNGDIQAINPTTDQETGNVTGYSISPVLGKPPKPPDGSIAAADGEPGVEKAAVPVPGAAKRAGQKAIAVATGKALVKAKEQYPKLLSSRATMLADADALTKMVDDAVAMLRANPKATGRWGTVALIDPESPASVLKVKLDNISAYAAFSALQQMREASVTGGALGQVSERELALLIASKFAGKHGLPAEDLIDALNTFRQRVKRAVEISEELTQNMAARIGGTIEGNEAIATGTTRVDKYLRQYLEK